MITVKRGRIGSEDVAWLSAASPTFHRSDSQGNATTRTSIGATTIPIANASLYFSQSSVERAVQETISRYFGIQHSTATWPGGARVGQHQDVYGFANALAATSIQAAASRQFAQHGVACLVLPAGTHTAATKINLPKNTFILGAGRRTIVRQNATVQTSALFRVAGSVGATQSNLTANATIGGRVVDVIDGTKFSRGQWAKIADNHNSELQKVLSIAGNTLTVEGKLRHTYRSAATVHGASLAYPAILFMDNLDLQLSDNTRGIGVEGTYVVQSALGKNLRISGAPIAAVKFHDSFDNRFECVTESPSALSPGYGIWLTGGSQDNELGGIGQGISRDVANGGNNMLWGRQYYGSGAASGVSNPVAVWYRHNKPTMTEVVYAATRAIAVSGSQSVPAEVYINGRVYRNAATVICDISRTRTPSTATIGGMMRGPAGATRAIHFYAVPTQFPSATRQWDLMADHQSAATGPIAAGTYPHWSWLGAVPTDVVARPSLHRFTQHGDTFEFRHKNYFLVLQEFAPAAMATPREVPVGWIPYGTSSMELIAGTSSDWVVSANRQSAYFNLRGSAAPSNWSGLWRCSGSRGPGGTTEARPYSIAPVTVNIPERLADRHQGFSYRIHAGATVIDFFAYFSKYTLRRSSFQ